jgi:hypothetical protein
LTSYANLAIATGLGSISAYAETVESEGYGTKKFRDAIQYFYNDIFLTKIVKKIFCAVPLQYVSIPYHNIWYGMLVHN